VILQYIVHTLSLHAIMSTLRTIGAGCIRLSRRSAGAAPCRQQTQQGLSSAAAPAAVTSQPEPSWRLASAVCLERLPVLTPSLTPFQQKIQAYYNQMDLENSLKSDHELRHISDLEREAERKASGDKLEAGVRTALDDEDAWKAEFEAFKPPTSLSTSSEDDFRSLGRVLQRPLHLVVQMEYEGGVVKWELPQAINNPGETMRNTAEKALIDCVGNKLQIQFLGNAPWSFYKHYYSKSVQEKTGLTGEKVFIFKAFYQGGEVNLNKCKDFKWLLREELSKSIMSRHEKKALFNILYDEK